MPLSSLGFINRVLFQWMFCRVYRVVTEQNRTLGWGILFPVAPLTGWGGPYWPKPRWFVRIK